MMKITPPGMSNDLNGPIHTTPETPGKHSKSMKDNRDLIISSGRPSQTLMHEWYHLYHLLISVTRSIRLQQLRKAKV